MRAGQPELVFEVAAVERPYHRTGLDDVSLIDIEARDPPLDLESKVHLANVDVAVKREGRGLRTDPKCSRSWNSAQVEEARIPREPTGGGEHNCEQRDTTGRAHASR